MPQAPESFTLRYENTGGDELIFEKRMITILHPHTPESTVRPERADLEVLISHNAEKHEGKKIQYVVMGGMNINAVEVHPVLSMLMDHADTVVGIAHPDAPQSKITPYDSPFNEKDSFANSGFATLRAIEQLIHDGVLDPEHPITIVGYSTGSAVITEAISQDQKESEDDSHPRDRYITSGVLLAPAGMLDIGEDEITQGVADTASQHWSEFYSDQIKNIKKLVKHPAQLFEALAEAMTDDTIENLLFIKQVNDIQKQNFITMENWPKEPEWEAIKKNHKLFERVENWLRKPQIQFLDSLLAHFHTSWIRQDGWPHLSPETPAFKRSKENVGHDVTENARNTISDMPIILWLGRDDKAIQVDKFLTSEDHKELDTITDINVRLGAEEEKITQRAKEKFPHNTDNVHVILSHGNHVTPRLRASVLEYYFLRYLHPDLLERQTTFVGSSKNIA